MKKLFAAILTAALMGLGLVATTGSPASAACGYTACVPTTTVASTKASVKIGKKGKVKAAVVASGNAKPVGTVKIVVRGPQGYKKVTEVPFNGTAGPVQVKTGKLFKRGEYTVVVKFDGPANGIFDESSDKTSFLVR